MPCRARVACPDLTGLTPLHERQGKATPWHIPRTPPHFPTRPGTVLLAHLGQFRLVSQRKRHGVITHARAAVSGAPQLKIDARTELVHLGSQKGARRALRGALRLLQMDRVCANRHGTNQHDGLVWAVTPTATVYARMH